MGVTFALRHVKRMPAKCLWSQEEEDALTEAKVAKLKATGAKHLQDTKVEREAKQAVKEAAAKRKRIERAEV